MEPITHSDLEFNLEEVFVETDFRDKEGRGGDSSRERDYTLPGSYKSFAKWEMNFGAEYEVTQDVQKRGLTDTANDYSYNKATRDYNWRLLYENITT